VKDYASSKKIPVLTLVVVTSAEAGPYEGSQTAGTTRRTGQLNEDVVTSNLLEDCYQNGTDVI
jgi:hypothetical protein